MIPFYVRPMTIYDVPKVHSLAFTNLDEYYSKDVFNLFLQQWPNGQQVACRYGGEIIGFICGSDLGPDRVGVALLVVDKESRGNGIGSQLLLTLRRNGILRGAQTVRLEVRKENRNALNFYRNRGFVTVETLESYYKNGGDAIRMIGLCAIDS
jgi:ribosomal-protein-alanine N-acetyltransferase